MKLIFSILTCFFFLFAKGQENKELKENVQSAINNRFPTTRMFDLKFENYLPTDFDSELFDNPSDTSRCLNMKDCACRESNEKSKASKVYILIISHINF